VVQRHLVAGDAGNHHYALVAPVRHTGGVREKYLTSGIARGGEEMRDIKKMTREEILAMLCAPGVTDEPEKSDFVEFDEAEEDICVENWIRRETE
jgi:hypothetical protein